MEDTYLDNFTDINEKKSLAKVTANHIKQLIIEKTLPSGQKLPNEFELCSRFNISRTTLREALKMLSAENIIEIRRGRGTFVAEKQPGISDDPIGVSFMDQSKVLYNLLEARSIIEPGISSLAAANRTDEDIDKLSRIIKESYRILKNNEDHLEIDVEFHNAVAEATHNEVLQTLLPIIINSLDQGYRETVNNKDSFEKAVNFHSKVFEAIKAKNTENAGLYMSRHMAQVRKDIFGK